MGIPSHNETVTVRTFLLSFCGRKIISSKFDNKMQQKKKNHDKCQSVARVKYLSKLRRKSKIVISLLIKKKFRCFSNKSCEFTEDRFADF